MKKIVLIGILLVSLAASADIVFCSTGTSGSCVERSDGQGFVCNPGGNECGGTWIMRK